MLVLLMDVLLFGLGMLVGWFLHKRHAKKSWAKVFAQLLAIKNKTFTKPLTPTKNNVIDLASHKNSRKNRLE